MKSVSVETEVRKLLAEKDYAVAAGQKLSIVQGDKVRMTIEFDYQGPALTCVLRCSIGSMVVGVFNETAYQRGTLNLPQCTTLTPKIYYLDIPTTSLSAGRTYTVEAKIEEYVSQTLTRLNDVIEVLGVTGNFQNFRIVSYEKV